MMNEKNIAVVGAGPAGLSFALMLAKSGLNVTVVEKQTLKEISLPSFDGRDIAMTHLSKKLLKDMNVWQRFEDDEIHPLIEATVQDGDSPYALHFERSDDGKGPLGYLVANHVIRRGLYEQVCEHENIELLCENEVRSVSSDCDGATLRLKTEDGATATLRSALVVAADSRFSNTRRMMGIGAEMKDYGRVMIVCNMKHQISHHNTAQECFYYGRTGAVLPLGEGVSSIVTTVPASGSAVLLDMDDEDFSFEMEAMLGHRLGKMELVSERCAYPLVGAFSNQFIGRRFALIGDAAVGMHPVTAHGYNLGLRSADTLARQILKAQGAGEDLGGVSVLQAYQWRHRLLARPLFDATNMIVQLFTDDRPAAKFVRKAAIRLGNNFLPFKKLVTHRLTNLSL